MKAVAGTIGKGRCAPKECWVRKGDAIVDVANGCMATDFLDALKRQSAAAWMAVKAIVFNPVVNEKKLHALILEKKFEEEELFGAFVEWMAHGGGLDNLKEPSKFVAYYQKTLRDRVMKCTRPKEKRRESRLVLLDDLFAKSADDGAALNPVDKIMKEELLSAGRNERLMPDEKAIVRKCFSEFWRKQPRHAVVLCLRNMGLSAGEIKDLIGESTDNNVSQLARRGGLGLAKLLRSKKTPMPGVATGKRPESRRESDVR